MLALPRNLFLALPRDVFLTIAHFVPLETAKSLLTCTTLCTRYKNDAQLLRVILPLLLPTHIERLLPFCNQFAAITGLELPRVLASNVLAYTVAISGSRYVVTYDNTLEYTHNGYQGSAPLPNYGYYPYLTTSPSGNTCFLRMKGTVLRFYNGIELETFEFGDHLKSVICISDQVFITSEDQGNVIYNNMDEEMCCFVHPRLFGNYDRTSLAVIRENVWAAAYFSMSSVFIYEHHQVMNTIDISLGIRTLQATSTHLFMHTMWNARGDTKVYDLETNTLTSLGKELDIRSGILENGQLWGFESRLHHQLPGPNDHFIDMMSQGQCVYGISTPSHLLISLFPSRMLI